MIKAESKALQTRVNPFGQVMVIAHLTFQEAYRRKLIWVGLGLGAVFIGLFATGFYFMWRDITDPLVVGTPVQAQPAIAGTVLLAGLYVINFLIVMVTVLTSVGSLSAEISSHTIHSIAAKPIKRWEIVLGKWLGHAGMLAIYVVFLSAGVMLAVYLISGYTPPNPVVGIAVLILESLTILSLTFFGSSLMSTLSNGVLVFMMYGLAFVGGWVEQIGAILESQVAVDIGIMSSFLMPSEALWRFASNLMEPPGIAGDFTPFASSSEPTTAFLIYAGIYLLVMLGLSIRYFNRRDF